MLISRRGLVLTASAFALASCATARPSGRSAAVRTTLGPLRGVALDNGVQAFLGVRYGAPPIGPLRFAAPQAPARSSTEIDATALGASSMQLASGGSAAAYPPAIGAALAQVFSSADDRARQSEDCLFLNVWTPAVRGARPVMVWFHGGGFNYGSGSWPAYNGANLARHRDVVVVTVNHRLNVFGYLHLADIGGELYAQSGNAGQLDCVAVLEWVRDNIGAFGGDPGNVTIFGQSGGGAKVSALMAMPAARGLFHKAIVQSGPGLRGQTRESATQTARAILADLVIDAADVTALNHVPAARLSAAAVAAQARMGGGGGMGGLRFAPVVDGAVLPAHPFDPSAPAQSANVPVMVGYTKDEQTLYVVGQPWWPNMTATEVAERLRPIAGARTDALMAAFRAEHPGDAPRYLYTDVTSASFAFIGSTQLAERKAAQNAAPVYAYRWDRGATVSDWIMRAPHTVEIPFVFHNAANAPLLLGAAPETLALGEAASLSWTNFARTGDPNAEGLPEWPAYDATRRATMAFDAPASRVIDDPYAEVRRILTSA